MHLCNISEIGSLMRSGDLFIEGGHEFLDEHRIALHMAELHEVVGDVDLRAPQHAVLKQIPLPAARLDPGSFYLGITRERFSLGMGLVASLHTRSRFARIGLETLQSSNFVVPGFGNAGPAPIIFEITVRRPTSHLAAGEAYCFANIYRIMYPRNEPNLKDYNNRFPMLNGGRA
ncbi:dCTP deaminase domain-containing protein [Streptomyces sediminimaris]|uniref:dCTP deaminase domain-containing protein n=1 Tax=Streptomyces sediminimaris TaxID=3383721 RepID=UPI00399BA34C